MSDVEHVSLPIRRPRNAVPPSGGSVPASAGGGSSPSTSPPSGGLAIPSPSSFSGHGAPLIGGPAAPFETVRAGLEKVQELLAGCGVADALDRPVDSLVELEQQDRANASRGTPSPTPKAAAGSAAGRPPPPGTAPPVSLLYDVREAIGTLYLQLGGVDYRTIALTTISAATEMLRTTSKSPSGAAGSTVPVAAVARVAETLSALTEEAKRLLRTEGVLSTDDSGVSAVPMTDGTSAASPTPLSSNNNAKPTSGGKPSSRRARPVFVSDSRRQSLRGGPGGDGIGEDESGTQQQDDRHSTAVFAEDGSGAVAGEAYDTAVLHPRASDRRASSSSLRQDDDDDDEEEGVGALRNRILRLTEDKQHLQHEILRLETHLDTLREECRALYAPAMADAAKIEEQLQAWSRRDAEDGKDPANGDETTGLRSPQSDRGGDEDLATTAPARQSAATPDALSEGGRSRRRSRAEADGQPKTPPGKSSSPNPRGGALSLDTSPISAGTQQAESASTAVPVLRPVGHPLEYAYDTQFRRNGMDMVWSAVHLTFTREFDNLIRAPSPRSEGRRRSSAAGIPPPPAATDAAAAMAQSTRSDAAFREFQRAFKATIADVVCDTYALRDHLATLETPLRSAYVANCLQAKVKTNSGVVQLLGSFRSERDVRVFSLGHNLVGESRVMPLVPLFASMYRMHTLNLSHNGLKNRAITALCTALQAHPSLQELDLSGNPFSRAGGKAILHLVQGRPHLLMDVRVEQTQMENALVDRIANAAEDNRRKAQEEATTASS